MYYLLFGLGLILAGSIFALIFSEKIKIYIFTVFLTLGVFFVCYPVIQSLIFTKIYSINFFISSFVGPVKLVLDPLSSFFILIISFMSLIAVIYSSSYLKPYFGKDKNINFHLINLSILISSMILLTTVQNALFFLIVWEFMSLSSFFLVIFENDKKEVLASGINYLIFMHISFLFLTASFILLSIKTSSFDFDTFKIFLSSDKITSNIVFLLFFIGFGIKAGFVPFHSWLPKAHPAAPSHVSAIMSSCMIKIGIYGIIRTLLLVGTPSLKITYMLFAVSIITSLYGILYALVQRNIKKLLAYSSIENIGIIGVGIAVGMLGIIYKQEAVVFLGFTGSLMHILNHSIFKNLLFLLSGAIYQKTHTKNIEKLGGLIKSMPYTAIFFLIASLAISGLPPFNGFISEFLIYFGMLKGLQIKEFHSLLIFTFSIACFALVGTMSLLCFSKAFSIIFLGIARSKNSSEVKSDVSAPMIFPLFVLVVLIFFIGILPQYAVRIVFNPIATILGTSSFSFPATTLNLLSTLSFSSILLISVSGLIFLIRKIILKNKIIYKAKTWGCAYEAPNSKMQYTGSSYISPFLSLTKPFFTTELDMKKPKGYFPKEASFKIYIKDIFEYHFIIPLINVNKKLSKSFYWIQKGDSQTYILYGLVFLILAIIGLAFF